MKFIYPLLLSAIVCSAQAQTELPGKHIQLIAGPSLHTSGDLSGIAFITEFESFFKKRLSYVVGIGGTIHSGVLPILYIDEADRPIDGSVRNTVAGAQVMGHIGYSPLRTSHHQLQARVGLVGRYQSSGNNDIVIIHSALETGLSIPTISYINIEPQKIYTVGGSAQILYNYTFKKVSVGILGGLQTDSHGDTILQSCATVGMRL